MKECNYELTWSLLGEALQVEQRLLCLHERVLWTALPVAPDERDQLRPVQSRVLRAVDGQVRLL